MPKRKSSTFDRALGLKLKQLRLSRKLSQSAIAHRLDVSTIQYSKYESGHTKLSAHTLAEIMALFDTPAHYFFSTDILSLSIDISS